MHRLRPHSSPVARRPGGTPQAPGAAAVITRGFFARSLAALTLLVVAATAAQAEAARYQIDPAHTFPSFSVSHLGFSLHRGRFNESSGSIVLDSAAGRGRVEINIVAASVDTGDAELEKQLRGPNFFNSAEYPLITFIGDEIAYSGEAPRSVSGNLTLLGVTRPVTLQIDHFHCGIHPMLRQFICGANARTTIRRADFGMNKFATMIGDEIDIVLQAEAIRESAADAVERVERPGRGAR